MAELSAEGDSASSSRMIASATKVFDLFRVARSDVKALFPAPFAALEQNNLDFFLKW